MIVSDLETWFVGCVLLLLAWVLDRFLPPVQLDGPKPQVAIYNFLIQLAVFVVTTLISRALAPKPKPPEPGKADIPDIKEGKAPVEIFGAVWRTESFLAGWKQLDPPEPIKLKQGKK
ncbi:MAG TPA: hypothetical protein VLC71_05870 [Thermomonas sp.]|nr:hypothetical protein [Thermomonas sp.]